MVLFFIYGVPTSDNQQKLRPSTTNLHNFKVGYQLQISVAECRTKIARTSNILVHSIKYRQQYHFQVGKYKKLFVKQLYNGGSDYPKVHKVGRFPRYWGPSSIRHSCLRNMYQRIDQTLSNRGPALGVFTRLLQQKKQFIVINKPSQKHDVRRLSNSINNQAPSPSFLSMKTYQTN